MNNDWTAADDFVENGAVTAHATEMSFDTRFSVKGLRGVWSDLVRCGPTTTCPGGSTCASVAGTGVTSCVSTTDTDLLVQAIEHRTPGADGVQPMALPDFNEWPHLRYGFCHTLREEGSAGLWAPVDYRESSASCAALPVYAR